MHSSPRTRFATIVAREDAELDLAEAALDIAADAYPHLDPHRYLERLDEMAAAIRDAVDDPSDPLAGLSELNRYLFEQEGFRGNQEAYYDPRNSYLNEVLDRRLGIPITLAVVYMELAWRLDLPLQGVSFPGHFLVRCPYRDGYLFLDPFHQGAALDTEQLAERVVAVLGDRARESGLLTECLGPASKREILGRMLRNLRAVYVERDDHARALEVCDRICVLNPEDPVAWRDRGELYRRLSCFGQAAADFEHYLELSPEAADAATVRTRLAELATLTPRLH